MRAKPGSQVPSRPRLAAACAVALRTTREMPYIRLSRHQQLQAHLLLGAVPRAPRIRTQLHMREAWAYADAQALGCSEASRLGKGASREPALNARSEPYTTINTVPLLVSVCYLIFSQTSNSHKTQPLTFAPRSSTRSGHTPILSLEFALSGDSSRITSRPIQLLDVFDSARG